MAGEGEPSLTEAPEHRIAVLFATFIAITYLFEKLTGYMNGFLKKHNRRGLMHTIHKLEEELLALGLISLLLLAFEEYVVQICSRPGAKGSKKSLSRSHKKSHNGDTHKEEDHKSDDTQHADEIEAVLNSEVEGLMTTGGRNSHEDMMLMDDDYQSADDATLAGEGHRRLLGATKRVLLAGEGGGGACPDGKESFWSIRILHETHIFIFLLAVSHIVVAAVSMVLCSWKVRQWKTWEQDSDKSLQIIDFRRLLPGRACYHLRVFSYQFHPHIGKAVYVSMRRLFIERMELSDDFDFHTFMVNCMEEGYAKVITLEWIMWLFALIWIKTNVIAVYTMMGVGLFVTFVAGAKLQSIAMKLQNEAYSLYANAHVSVKPNILQRNLARLSNRLAGVPTLQTQKTHDHGPDKNCNLKMPSPTDETSESESGGQDSEAGPAANERKVGCAAVSLVGLMVHPTVTAKNIVLGFHESWGKLGLMADAEKKKMTFSPSYKANDSASYFLFKRPHLVLRLFQYTFFMTSMTIAILTFNHWQEADPKLILTSTCAGVILMVVGLVVMVLTSLLILPVYWLTMAVGSHCPSNVLKRAKKARLEPRIVSTLEQLSMNPKSTLVNLAKTSTTPQQGVCPDATTVLAPILSDDMEQITERSPTDAPQEAGGRNMKAREKAPEVASSALGMLVGAMVETKARELQTLAHTEEEGKPPSRLERRSLAGGECTAASGSHCKPALAKVSAPDLRSKRMGTGARDQEDCGDKVTHRKKPATQSGSSGMEQKKAERARAAELEAAAVGGRRAVSKDAKNPSHLDYKGFVSRYDGKLMHRQEGNDVDPPREYGKKPKSRRE